MMADEEKTEEAKAQPTLAELEAKLGRLETQASKDKMDAGSASEAFAKIVKSGDVDRALKAADERTAAIRLAEKSAAQLKTATNAVASQKLAANAGKRADIHDAMRTDKSVVGHMDALFSLGAEWVKLEKSSEDGSLIINSGGGEVKRARSGGGGGGTGSRGEPLTVDGTEYKSANAANLAFFPDSGPLNRQSIVSKLVNAGHEVS